MSVKPLTPRNEFDIKVFIGGEDYSGDLVGCNISYNLSTIYPIIELKFLLPPDSILLDQIYGDKRIDLKIEQLSSEDQTTIDELSFRLIHLESKFPMPIGSKLVGDEQSQKDYVPFIITSVPLDPFIKYKKIINKVYHDVMLENIIQDIINIAGFELDSDRIRNLHFKQFLLPPSSCINHLKYLKDVYGIFEGISAFFSDETGKLSLYNLTQRFNSREIFIATQLSVDDQQNLNRIESLTDNQYIITSDVKSSYNLNSLIGSLTFNQKYIISPKDNLYEIKTYSIEELINEYGLKHQNNNLFILDEIKNTTGTYTTGTQLGTDDFIDFKLLKQIANLSMVSFHISRGYKLSDFKQVGNAFILDFTSEKYKDLYGKYICFGVNYSFRYDQIWVMDVEMLGARTMRVY